MGLSLPLLHRGSLAIKLQRAVETNIIGNEILLRNFYHSRFLPQQNVVQWALVSIFQDELDTDSDEFRDALEKLNAALKEENLNALKDLATKENEHLPEDRIIVCLGNHLIANLAGKAVTSKTKSKLSCPCTSKCGKRLQAEERMYIGKCLIFGQHTWTCKLKFVLTLKIFFL